MLSIWECTNDAPSFPVAEHVGGDMFKSAPQGDAIFIKFILPFVVHKLPCAKRSGFWIPVIQVFASFNLVLSIVMSVNFLKFEKTLVTVLLHFGSLN
ncbi:hypothetical protein ABKV19_008935 [Rosa sericea]